MLQSGDPSLSVVSEVTYFIQEMNISWNFLQINKLSMKLSLRDPKKICARVYLNFHVFIGTHLVML